MTWRITKAKPVAGVELVKGMRVDKSGKPIMTGPPEVLLSMNEAFDEEVSFETVAAHLHLHPKALLDDLCLRGGTKQAEAIRHLARVAILKRLRIWSDENIGVLSDPGGFSARWLRDTAKRNHAFFDTKTYKRVFPHWRVPLTLDEQNPLCILTRLSPDMRRVIDFRTKNFEQMHGHYEDHHEAFEELRQGCSQIIMHARQARRYATLAKKSMDQVLPPLNKIIALFTTMLEFFEEGFPPPNAKDQEKRLWTALRRRSDLLLLSRLCTEYFLHESGAAELQRKKVQIFEGYLDGLDHDAVARMLSWGQNAPSVVWYEYHEAMAEAAAALASAPRDLARPLVEKHFVPAFRELVRDGNPSFEAGAFSDAEQRSLAAAIKDFDQQTLGALDKSDARPAYVTTKASGGNIEILLEQAATGVTAIETTLDIASHLGPQIASYIAETEASGSRVAAFLFRAAHGMSGLTQAEHETKLLEILTTRALEPQALARELDKLRQHIGNAALETGEGPKKLMYTSVVWPGLQICLQIAAIANEYDPQKMERTSKDYAKLAEVASNIVGVGTKTVLAHYDDVLMQNANATLVAGLKGGQISAAVRFVDKVGMFFVTNAIALWTAHATAEEKREWGDMSGGKDMQAALFSVALSALALANPVAGAIVTFALELAKAFSGEGGTEAHTIKWYKQAWSHTYGEIKKHCKLGRIPLDEVKILDAYEEDKPAPLLHRIRALCYRIESGQWVISETEPDSLSWMWSLHFAEWGRLERLLKRYGYSDREITFLRERS